MISFQNKNGSETGAVPHISETTDSMHKATGSYLDIILKRKRLSINSTDVLQARNTKRRKADTAKN